MSRAVLRYSPTTVDGEAHGMKVGLTGGIGAGKSTVSKMLTELGAVVIDADQIARQVVARGTPGLQAVVAEFGEGILTEEGEMDRPAVAAIVFNDPDALKRLEGITHPLIFAEVLRQEEAAPAGAVIVHDQPLLTELGQADQFDAVLVVDVPVEVQIERIVRDRGWTPEEAQARINAQASREDRLAVATYVIDNTGTVADLRARVDEVWQELTSTD